MKCIFQILFKGLYKGLEIIVRYGYGALVYFLVFIWTFSLKSAKTQWKELQRDFDGLSQTDRIACTLVICTGLALLVGLSLVGGGIIFS